jgi:hypothetical protein
MSVDGSIEEVNLSTTVEPLLLGVSITDKTINAIIQSSRLDVDLIAYDTILEDDEVYDVETDFSTPGVYYVGQAPVGSLTSEAVWRIRRITESLNGTSIDWAEGSADFVNVWDDRLDFTYGP